MLGALGSQQTRKQKVTRCAEALDTGEQPYGYAHAACVIRLALGFRVEILGRTVDKNRYIVLGSSLRTN